MIVAPTAEEIQRVREWECRNNGHTWSVVTTFIAVPVRLSCRNCGRSYAIEYAGDHTQPLVLAATIAALIDQHGVSAVYAELRSRIAGPTDVERCRHGRTAGEHCPVCDAGEYEEAQNGA